MIGLARHLLDLEAAREDSRESASDRQATSSEPANAVSSQVESALRVLAKLQKVVVRFSGADGFAALLSRALSLAKKGDLTLVSVQVKPDGTLDGFAAIANAEAAIAMITQMLELMTVFVGTPVTRVLLGEAWPQGLK